MLSTFRETRKARKASFHIIFLPCSCAIAPEKGTSLPQQSVTLVPCAPRAYKFTSLSYMKTYFFHKTVNVVRRSIVWNQIRWFVFTFILKPHKTVVNQKFKVHFLFCFFSKGKVIKVVFEWLTTFSAIWPGEITDILSSTQFDMRENLHAVVNTARWSVFFDRNLTKLFGIEKFSEDIACSQ